MGETGGASGPSPRKEELLRRTLEYAAEHNLSDLSLRPLAKAIGSSPRVLLYLFGSKNGLIREVLALNRAEQLALLDEALAGSATPREALDRLWEWITDPARHHLRRLFFEAYTRALGDDATWDDFAARSVNDWLPPLRRLVRNTRADGEAEATLVLAVLRGLLLDLLASDDTERVTAAWQAFLDRFYP
ncbi:TetR/AcrR family transcriptional regulator [Carbonactinospora thermoautotrophica]|nr:TetR/AcrR family transcriptional regulator [Carbonactinospora thermoautotrophica]